MSQKGFASTAVLVVILVLVAIGGAYYLGTQRNLQISISPNSEDNLNTITKISQIASPSPGYNSQFPYGTNYTILSGCNGTECLFKSPSDPEVVEGFAKLKGYYKQYDSTDFGAKITCDALVVTGGSSILVSSLKAEIAGGNSVNKYDKDNNLMVNINLDNIDGSTKQRIIDSSAKAPIEVGVIRITPQPRGGSTCSNFVDILYAK